MNTTAANTANCHDVKFMPRSLTEQSVYATRRVQRTIPGVPLDDGTSILLLSSKNGGGSHELATFQRSGAGRSQNLRRAGTDHRTAHPRSRRRVCGAPRAAAR